MTRRWVVGLVVALAAALSGCEGGSPAPRGFGSTQILQLRDTKFYFLGSRGDIVLYGIGTVPADSLFYSLDLRTGVVTPNDGSFVSIPYPSYTYPADPNARYHCSYVVDADIVEFRIADAQTGQTTDIPNVNLASNCPTESDPTLKIWRTDGTGYQTLWTGPFDNLQMAPIDLAIAHPFGGLGRTTTVATVIAGPSAQPDALGIYSIDLTTFAVTERVPAALAGGAWADGAPPVGALDSASLDPKAPDSPSVVGDHFLYWRAMADGGETLFAGPFASGAREVALFTAGAAAPKRGYVRSTLGKYLSASALPIWQRWPDSTLTGPSDLLIWDDTRQRLLTCLSAFTSTAIGVLSDDHGKLAAFVGSIDDDPTVQELQPTGPLMLVDMTSPAAGNAACTTVVASDVNVAGFAPDGSTMFWLVDAPYPDMTAQLFFAAPDGSAPRLVADDRIEGPPHEPHFVGPSQLEIDIFADLVWADVHDDPLISHPIAERITGGVIDRGRWLIIGYGKSVQDGTATLGIVNRDDGNNKKRISPDVDTFFTPDLYSPTGRVEPSPQRTADDPMRIVYMVRGRNPSPQDGLWVANIYPSDTP